MRRLALLPLGLLAALAIGCSDPCDDKAGNTTCGYCDKDAATSSNSHAGKCRYCSSATTCSGDPCSDALMCVSKANIFVPKSSFRKGAAPQPTGLAGAPPAARVITAASHALSPGATLTWTVQWDATVTVSAVLVAVGQFGGYYEVPVTEDESSAGTVLLALGESLDAPGESGCLGPTTCWTEAPETTTAELAVALVGAGGEVGQPAGGLGLTWSTPSYRQSGPSTTPGCPGSAAELGCCTTNGGVQVLGVGLSPACGCPDGTCPIGTGYCGCRGCGGCS